jgi:hypothetical protein
MVEERGAFLVHVLSHRSSPKREMSKDTIEQEGTAEKQHTMSILCCVASTEDELS